MGTRKSVDQILDKAADILERDGWVTEQCYDDESGGYCALGAIAQAVYPKAPASQVSALAYVIEDVDADYEAFSGGVKKDPRHVEAVIALALQISRRKSLPADGLHADQIVYSYNDSKTGKTVTLKSAQKVINAMRRAAEKYRASVA